MTTARRAAISGKAAPSSLGTAAANANFTY